MKVIITILILSSFFIIFISSKAKHTSAEFEEILQNFYQRKVNKRENIQETHMKAEAIIQQNNYSCETYTVTTKDGYVLTLHRIPRAKGCHRKRTKRQSPKPPVFLMHGVMASTTNFIISGPQSLAFLLADNGYDVWIGNARGNPYSRVHRNLLPSNMKFWDFSFHEIGLYDLPAIIDFILDETGFPNLFYVGHSQGSTVILILLALLPIYNQRVIAAFLLSPVAYMNHMTSPFLILFSLMSNPIGLFFDLIGYGEFLPNMEIMRTIARWLCRDGDFTQIICSMPLFLITGLNPANVPANRLPIYVANAGSVSGRQLIHYGQLYNSGEFRPFDFGIIENYPMYQSLKPPNYPLGNVRIPLYMFNAKNDWLANPIDVARLHREVPSSILIELPDPTFSHLDYILASKAPDLIYFPIIWNMNNLSIIPPPLPNIPGVSLPQIPRLPIPKLPLGGGVPYPNMTNPNVPPPFIGSPRIPPGTIPRVNGPGPYVPGNSRLPQGKIPRTNGPGPYVPGSSRLPQGTIPRINGPGPYVPSNSRLPQGTIRRMNGPEPIVSDNSKLPQDTIPRINVPEPFVSDNNSRLPQGTIRRINVPGPFVSDNSRLPQSTIRRINVPGPFVSDISRLPQGTIRRTNVPRPFVSDISRLPQSTISRINVPRPFVPVDSRLPSDTIP